MIILKPGDKIVCVEDHVSHDTKHNSINLYKNRIYTISEMIKRSPNFGFIDISCCQYDTSDKESVRISLVEVNTKNNKSFFFLHRFITLTEFHKYRKEKIIKINDTIKIR